MRRIDELHLTHQFVDASMLLRELRKEGIDAGRCHVRTLTQRLDIETLCPPPGTSKAPPGYKIYPYLLRNAAVTWSIQVWAPDTTCIPMAHGFVSLKAVADVASRRLPAHKLTTALEAYHAVEIITQAFAGYGIPEIVNTGHGSRLTVGEFTHAVLSCVCRLSMDGKGAWRGRVFVERLWRTVKYEQVYLRAYDRVTYARADIAEYIGWHNVKPGHTRLAGMAPDAAYRKPLPKLKVAA